VAGREARCWGANDNGQLGRATDLPSTFVPVQVAFPVTVDVTAIAAGSAHTCAIANGDVWCWGDNTFGQLGSGPGPGGSTPKHVTAGGNALRLAAGSWHTCYADTSTVSCWGKNDFGQLGDGAVLPGASRFLPNAVAGLTAPSMIAAGESHTCAIASGGVWCWGANGAGQLGNGSGTSARSSPDQTSPTLLALFLGLGANHSCADDGSGALFCWGANASFQIDGSGQDYNQPKGVLSGTSGVTGGIGHTCAIHQGRVTCWGLNNTGQLGSGQLGHNQVDVQGLSSVTAVASSYQHNCAIDAGAVKCWGLNDRSQLGVASPSDFSSGPVPVSGL